DQAVGTRLLGQAADAGVATSYQGTELITQARVDGSVRVTSQVRHQAGGETLVQTSDTGTLATASTQADVASGSQDGVFGVTRSLVALLSKHYFPMYAGSGTVVGRPAAVVELYRFDGSLAARYWLDKRTTLPLRRELLGTTSSVISDDSFV